MGPLFSDYLQYNKNHFINKQFFNAIMSKTTPTTFKIKSITEQDKDRVLQYLRQYFYGDEPLNEYLNRESTTQSTTNNRGLESTSSIKEGLSIMALTPANKIVGVIINKNFKAGVEAHRSLLENSFNFNKIIKLVEKLEEGMASLAQLQNDNAKEMSIRIISVHPQWRNNGVGFALLERTRTIAEENGFSQVRTICTSFYSARIMEKLGFHCIHSIKYEDYKENGEVVFKPNPPHTHIQAMFLRI